MTPTDKQIATLYRRIRQDPRLVRMSHDDFLGFIGTTVALVPMMRTILEVKDVLGLGEADSRRCVLETMWELGHAFAAPREHDLLALYYAGMTAAGHGMLPKAVGVRSVVPRRVARRREAQWQRVMGKLVEKFALLSDDDMAGGAAPRA